MFVRSLAVALLVGLNIAFAAPMPFVAKKKLAPTAVDLTKQINGSFRVVSYEYGNNAAIRRGIPARITYTEVVIKDGSWTQTRDIGGRKLAQSFSMKLDTSKPVPSISLTYAGNSEPVFFGIVQVNGNQLTVTYGTRGREVSDPFAALGVGQYRWVLERMK